mgnify:CR=1 FL=1
MTPGPQPTAGGVARDAGTVAVVTALSRVVGFARWLVFAWAVGATGASPASLPKPDKAELAAAKAYFKQHAKTGPTEYAAPFAAPKTMLAGRLTHMA